MDINTIQQRVRHIEQCKGDYECAHGMEDQLMQDFIKHVAEKGSPKLKAMAREVLKTEDIDFPRYCA